VVAAGPPTGLFRVTVLLPRERRAETQSEAAPALVKASEATPLKQREERWVRACRVGLRSRVPVSGGSLTGFDGVCLPVRQHLEPVAPGTQLFFA